VQRSWRKIGEATLSRVNFHNLKREDLSIAFPESRHAHYRIVIENRDSPPLAVSGIMAEGNVYEILYLAGPDRHDRLLYGSDDGERASYDTAAIEELLRSGIQPTEAELGPEGAGTGRPVGVRWSKLFTNPVVLGGTVTVLVIALGWGLFRAVQRMDTMSGGPGEGE
jgi:hypothetical protein